MLRGRIVDDGVGVFSRADLEQGFIGLGVEHHDGAVVAGSRESATDVRDDRCAMRAIDSPNFSDHPAVIHVDHRHPVLPCDEQPMIGRVGDHIVPTAFAADGVGVSDRVRLGD